MRPTPKITLILALFFAIAGCGDTSMVGEERLDQDADDVVTAHAQDLSLSRAQAAAMRSLLQRDGRADHRNLWAIAVRLQDVLTPEQKEALFARRDRPQRAEFRDRNARRSPARGILARVATQEQGEDIKALRDSHAGKARALLEDDTLSAESKRDALKALRASLHSAILNLLSAEQQAELERFRSEFKSQWDGRRGIAEAARTEALGLTAAQIETLTELREKHRAELRALLGGSRGDREEALRTLREAHETAIAAALTPIQIEIIHLHRALQHAFAGRRGQSDARRGPGRR